MDKNDYREMIMEIVAELKNANNKAKTIMGDINSNYFGERNPKNNFLKYYYNTTSIKISIVLDYVNKIDLILKKMEEMATEENNNNS